MKKQNLSRVLGICIVFTMVLGLFTACVPPATDNTTGSTSNVATDATTNAPTQDTTTKKEVLAPGEKVKISVWYAVSGASGDAFKELVEKFTAENNQIEIELSYSGNYGDTATKVSAALTSGAEPNVALMSAGPLFTGARGTYFIEEKINEADFDKADFFESGLDYSKYKGKVCALPYGISTPILYYNKNILDKAGIDTSKPPETWDDLYEMAKIAQAKGNINNVDEFWGFEVRDVPWLFKTMLNQNENPVVNVDANFKVTPAFDDENAVEVATWWKKMVDDKVMPAAQHANAEKTFLAGNSAFIVSTSNRISRWVSEEGVKVGAFPMPYFKKKSVALGGNVLVMFNKNEKEDYAAWELLNYLVDTQNQTEFALKTGYLPIRRSGLELDVAKKALSENPMYKIAFDQMEYSWSYWHFEQMGTMDMMLTGAMEKVEKNVLSPKDALEEAAKELAREIDMDS